MSDRHAAHRQRSLDRHGRLPARRRRLSGVIRSLGVLAVVAVVGACSGPILANPPAPRPSVEPEAPPEVHFHPGETVTIQMDVEEPEEETKPEAEWWDVDESRVASATGSEPEQDSRGRRRRVAEWPSDGGLAGHPPRRTGTRDGD